MHRITYSTCISRVVRGTFQALHARALCHATEDLEKVKRALASATGTAEIQISRTEGHHGNPIFVLEATINGHEEIQDFFERLPSEDLRTLLHSLPSRIDDGCNLFIRLDKQSSYDGKIRLAHNDDVISVRLRVMAFPAKFAVASASVRGFIEDILKARESHPVNP